MLIMWNCTSILLFALFLLVLPVLFFLLWPVVVGINHVVYYLLESVGMIGRNMSSQLPRSIALKNNRTIVNLFCPLQLREWFVEGVHSNSNII